jgi:hypothetical protein
MRSKVNFRGMGQGKIMQTKLKSIFVAASTSEPTHHGSLALAATPTAAIQPNAI